MSANSGRTGTVSGRNAAQSRLILVADRRLEGDPGRCGGGILRHPGWPVRLRKASVLARVRAAGTITPVRSRRVSFAATAAASPLRRCTPSLSPPSSTTSTRRLGAPMSSFSSPSCRTPLCMSWRPGIGKPPGTIPWPRRLDLTSRCVFESRGIRGSGPHAPRYSPDGYEKRGLRMEQSTANAALVEKKPRGRDEAWGAAVRNYRGASPDGVVRPRAVGWK